MSAGSSNSDRPPDVIDDPLHGVPAEPHPSRPRSARPARERRRARGCRACFSPLTDISRRVMSPASPEHRQPGQPRLSRITRSSQSFTNRRVLPRIRGFPICASSQNRSRDHADSPGAFRMHLNCPGIQSGAVPLAQVITLRLAQPHGGCRAMRPRTSRARTTQRVRASPSHQSGTRTAAGGARPGGRGYGGVGTVDEEREQCPGAALHPHGRGGTPRRIVSARSSHRPGNHQVRRGGLGSHADSALASSRFLSRRAALGNPTPRVVEPRVIRRDGSSARS